VEIFQEYISWVKGCNAFWCLVSSHENNLIFTELLWLCLSTIGHLFQDLPWQCKELCSHFNSPCPLIHTFPCSHSEDTGLDSGRLKLRMHWYGHVLCMMMNIWKVTAFVADEIQEYIQNFLYWADNKINNNNKHSLRSNTKGYGDKTR
jgi:hypothetical protein